MKLTGDIVETLKVLKTENAVGYKLKLKWQPWQNWWIIQNDTGINHERLALQLTSKERNENSEREQLLKEFFYFSTFADL